MTVAKRTMTRQNGYMHVTWIALPGRKVPTGLRLIGDDPHRNTTQGFCSLVLRLRIGQVNCLD